MISPIIPYIYPLERIENLPTDDKETILTKLLPERSIENFKKFLEITIFQNGLVFRGLKFHLDFPYLTLFHIHDFFSLPKEALCFLWYICEVYTVGFIFYAPRLTSYLSIVNNNYHAHNDMNMNFWKFMNWFKPTVNGSMISKSIMVLMC